MLTDFLQRLFSSDCRRNNIEEQQMKEILRQNDSESNISIQSDDDTIDTTSLQSPYSNDIQVLKDRFGLVSGQCIELGLKEALEMMPRKRQKSDAYKGLVSELRKAYGVELRISSIKSHNNNESDERQ